MDKLNKIIYYSICDFMYQEYIGIVQKKKDDFKIPFDVLCNDMSTRLDNGVNFNKTQIKLFHLTMDRITNFFAISDEEFGLYFKNFLEKKMWLKTYASVKTMNYLFNFK